MSFVERMRLLFKKGREALRQDRSLEARQLLQHVSIQLEELSASLEQQVQDAASGSRGRPSATVEYIIRDRSGAELQTEWQDRDHITREDIKQSDAYLKLQGQTQQLGLKLKLEEQECEEFDDEDRVRFVVHVSGWA